ncbi:ZINC FINGER HIT DOMAIN CONTAINING PROTEIN 1 [Salix koriyanagi]|uniref:ZINC FINGER HIT DOMAIN CONTAINING PROTEIN 1 n=1 Tax=Salix koriyanagi TaxID=2511006 RepID=A0A9Q0ZBE2_9ROSI|nr:ZINC FINGER HIT DOMAIN CONTAINING PROTEIN 1 [Salix koriyanagi]
MIWYRWFSGSMRASRAQRSEQAYEKEFIELPTFFSRKTATSIVEAVNRLMIARCDHEQMKNAEGYIMEIIGEINLDHFFVGTQDTDMRKKFQERHARSEKLMKENRLKVILNSDGEIENMDEETHAERHARTVALAQELNPKALAFLHLDSLSFSLISPSRPKANGRLRFKPVSKSVDASSKDCSKMEILHASNDNKTQAAIARLEALENDYTRIETVEAVDDDEASLEDDVYIQKKQKDSKHKTRQVKALENARKAPRNFLELIHELWDLQALLAMGISALFVSSFPIIHVRSVECVFVQSDVRRYMMIPLA